MWTCCGHPKLKVHWFCCNICFNVWVFENKLIENFVFWRYGLNSSVFEKLFISYSCILFIKKCALRSFCIKTLCFSKNYFFSKFSINRTCCSTDWNCNKNFGLNLPNSIDARLMLDRSKLKNFQFLIFWPNFFHASFMFRIHMHCIIFYIHLVLLQSYLSLFHT